MKIPVSRILFILVALAAAAVSLTRGDRWLFTLIAAAVFVLAALLIRDNDDSLILTLASGEILVIAVGAASFWAGCVVQGAVIGAVLLPGRQGLPDTRELGMVALACIAVLGCALIIDQSSRVLVPFLALMAVVAAGTFIFIGVQEMRERRMYAGGK